MKRQPGHRRKRPIPGPVTPLVLRLPLKLKTALDAEAAKRGISLAAYIREALTDYQNRAKLPSRQIEDYNKAVFQRKREWRRREAKLPIEEKMRTLLSLQHLAYDIGQSQGRLPPRPWDMNA